MLEQSTTQHLEHDRVTAIADLLHSEVTALTNVLPHALARQWEPSPVPRPREDTTERTSGGDPTRPVEDVALDPRRLAVRAALRDALSVVGALRSSRVALTAAVARFDGGE